MLPRLLRLLTDFYYNHAFRSAMTTAYLCPATNRSIFGKSFLFAACVALSLGSLNQAAAQEAPSNAELYKMLLELKSENAKLKGEVQRLQSKSSSPQASAPSYQG